MEYQKEQERLQEKLTRLEAMIAKQREILERHKIRYDKHPLESHLRRITAKEEQIETLEARMILTRGNLKEVIHFNPAEQQFSEVSREFRKVRGNEWRKVPNGVWKTMQDLFAPPGYRITPKENGIFGGDWENIPLDTCIIDPNPRRSAYRFLKEFGLADFPKKMTSFERIKEVIKSKPELIRAFGQMKPMSPYGPAENGDDFRLLVIEGLVREHDGKILATMQLGRQSPTEDRKIFQVYGSIYPAHRKALHAKKSYTNETPKIFGVLERVTALSRQTRGIKKGSKRKDAIMEQLGREIEILERATNYFKAQAADLLKEVRGIRDSLGRHNPGVTCAKLIAVLNRLNERLPQIKYKAEAMGEDEQVMSMRIDRAEGILEECFRGFKTICEKTEAYEKNDKSGELFQGYDEMEEEIKRGLEAMENVNELHIRPFNLYGKKLEERKRDITGALDKKDINALRDNAIKGYIITKLFRIQKERERILKEVSLMPEETDIRTLLEKAEELGEVATKRQVYPFTETHYEPVYREVEQRVETLIKGLRMHAGKEYDTESKKAMYGRLQKWLEELDFEQILAELKE